MYKYICIYFLNKFTYLHIPFVFPAGDSQIEEEPQMSLPPTHKLSSQYDQQLAGKLVSRPRLYQKSIRICFNIGHQCVTAS